MRRSVLSYCSPYVRWLEAQQEKLEHVLEVLAGVKTIESTAGEQLSEAHPDKGKRATSYGLSSEGVRAELEKRAQEGYDSAMKHGVEFSARETWKKHHKENEDESSTQQRSSAHGGNSGTSS